MGSTSSKEEHRGVTESRVSNLPQKKATISSSDKIKLQLKVQRDSLRASIKKYELVGSLEHQKAKELLKAGNKRKALYCLKCEKIQESRIEKLTVMYDNIDRIIDTLQIKEVEVQVFESLKTGQKELEKLNNMLKIEEIEKLMSETAESIDEAQQINDVLAQPIDNRVVDEDELLQMLADDVGTLDSDVVKMQKVSIPETLPNKNAPSVSDERVMVSV